MRRVIAVVFVCWLCVGVTAARAEALDYMVEVPATGIAESVRAEVMARYRAEMDTRWTSATLCASPRIVGIGKRLAAMQGFKPSATAQAWATAGNMTLVPDRTTFRVISAGIEIGSGDLRSVDYWVVGKNTNTTGPLATIFVHFTFEVEPTWMWRTRASATQAAQVVPMRDSAHCEFGTHHYVLSDADFAEAKRRILATVPAGTVVESIYGEGDR